MPLSIELAVEDDAWTDRPAGLGSAKDIKMLAKRAVAAALAQGDAMADAAELSLVLCDDAFIRQLNAHWRGKDQATNVLSFPAPTAMRDRILGDIVVAYDTSAREADERGMPLAAYLAHLIVHGVFHLLGYDHENDAQAERMEVLESRALAEIGIESPYIDDGPAAGRRFDAAEPREDAAGLRVIR